jgi:hypothetical protein
MRRDNIIEDGERASEVEDEEAATQARYEAAPQIVRLVESRNQKVKVKQIPSVSTITPGANRRKTRMLEIYSAFGGTNDCIAYVPVRNILRRV